MYPKCATKKQKFEFIYFLLRNVIATHFTYLVFGISAIISGISNFWWHNCNSLQRLFRISSQIDREDRLIGKEGGGARRFHRQLGCYF